MKIIIITDGGSKIGMGHIYQSISLADALSQDKQIRAEIFFLTKSGEEAIAIISNSGYSVYQHTDDNSIFNSLKYEKPDRVIFDKIDVHPALACKIKTELNSKLIILTNLTEANKYADVTVLADIGSNFKNIYAKDKITGKVSFFGPKYWLLRPEFYEYKKKKKTFSKLTKDVLLIFGGADPCNFSSVVLNVLLQMHSSYNITLVLGSAFLHHKELATVLKQNPSSKSKIEVVQNVNNVAEMMYYSDVVIASPGLSFFEALVVGRPVIGFHQDNLQRDTYKGLLTTFGKDDLHKLPLIMGNNSFTFPSDPFVSAMEIGEGKSEIIYEILN